ncbi:MULTISPECIES: RidA family protein [Enterococcus]|uniref:RidA family protein n=1 Tax=Enterococcus TaxID=1350 RepID=UPI001E2C2E80|nr:MULTISPECIES: RidA family protein [Enterococcus]MCD1025123.1 RidA family protein [Enterococcus sp. SMC-9]MDT2740503.1 RidA family protein [Enterococcus canintestini]WHA10477.1 RidA family protein [Enterococcus montenegrensis]
MKNVTTNLAPQAIGPYVQGKIVNGFLFASGQIPLDPNTGEMVGTTIEEQTVQVFKNIQGLLKSCDLTMDDVVKTTCFLKDINDFAAFNTIYATYFNDSFPARSALQVAALPKDAMVEIEIIAVVK